ncbi:hypothetical protein OH77DRAFT_836904 [Trametes cingulata]|nr:hypothetical protein OH77DRAFT_836904 [Trametes cingulata]
MADRSVDWTGRLHGHDAVKVLWQNGSKKRSRIFQEQGEHHSDSIVDNPITIWLVHNCLVDNRRSRRPPHPSPSHVTSRLPRAFTHRCRCGELEEGLRIPNSRRPDTHMRCLPSRIALWTSISPPEVRAPHACGGLHGNQTRSIRYPSGRALGALSFRTSAFLIGRRSLKSIAFRLAPFDPGPVIKLGHPAVGPSPTVHLCVLGCNILRQDPLHTRRLLVYA